MREDFFLGIDIGSSTAEAVVVDSRKRLLARDVAETRPDHAAAAHDIFASALARLSRSKGRPVGEEEIRFSAGTGYGRGNIPFADAAITEIAAHARGVRHSFPGVRTIIDIGGQDSKAIAVGPDGRVVDFAMNEKCAAGSGRFLEKMSEILEIPIDEIGPLSRKARRESKISSMCAVFAESEVISLLAVGEPKEAILKGVHSALVSRVFNLVKRIGLHPPLAFCGGAARNVGMVDALIRESGLPASQVLIPPEPQITGALGAALFALEEFGRRASDGRA